jgi:O-antigen/teichoic acid export membrane protein
VSVASLDARRRIAGSSLVALAGGVVSFLLLAGYQVAVARALGADAFGLFVLALVICNLLAEACDLGLDYGVLRFGAIAHGAGAVGRLRSVIWQGLFGAFLAGTGATVLLVAGATFIAGIFDKPGVARVLVPLAISIPFTGTAEVARACLRAIGRAVPAVASGSLVTPLVRLAVGLLALRRAAEPESVAVGYAVTEAVALAATIGMLLPRLPRGGRRTPTPGLFRYSLPMSLNRVILYTNNQTEVLVLGMLASAAAVGVFGVALRLSAPLGALLASIAVLFNPMVADLDHRRDHAQLDRLFKTATRWVFTAGLPLCVAEIVLAHDLLRLFGHGFAGGATALAILALGQLINIGTGTVAGVLAMIGRAWLSLTNALLFLGLSLVLDLVLIPGWGLLGAAVANAIALATVNLLRVVQVHRALGVSPYDRSFLRPLAAGLLAGLAVWLLPSPALAALPRLGLRLLVLGGIYLGLLVVFGIDRDDREVGRALLDRLRKRPRAAAATRPVLGIDSIGPDGDQAPVRSDRSPPVRKGAARP